MRRRSLHMHRPQLHFGTRVLGEHSRHVQRDARESRADRPRVCDGLFRLRHACVLTALGCEGKDELLRENVHDFIVKLIEDELGSPD